MKLYFTVKEEPSKKMLNLKAITKNKADWIFFGSVVVYFVFYVSVGWGLANSFLLGREDTATFVNVIWRLVHGKSSWTWAFAGGPISVFFGNHLAPIILLYLPIYGFFENVLRTSIVFEGLWTAVSAVPIYFFAKDHFNNKYQPYLFASVYLWYFTSPPFHFYFHIQSAAFFSLGLLSFHRNKPKWAFFYFVVAVMYKEYLALVLIGLGMSLFLRKEKNNKAVITYLSVGLFWLLFANIVMRLIQPSPFGQAGYFQLFLSDGHFQMPAASLILKKIFAHDNFERWLTMALPFIFGPLFAWELLLPMIPLEFVNSLLGRHGLRPQDHHIFMALPFVVFAGVKGVSRMQEKFHSNRAFEMIATIVLSIFFVLGVRHYVWVFLMALFSQGAFAMHTQDVRHVIANIPEYASVATVENLEPALSLREDVIHLQNLEQHSADIVVLDSFYAMFFRTRFNRRLSPEKINQEYLELFHRPMQTSPWVTRVFKPKQYKFDYSLGSLSVFSKIKNKD